MTAGHHKKPMRKFLIGFLVLHSLQASSIQYITILFEEAL